MTGGAIDGDGDGLVGITGTGITLLASGKPGMSFHSEHWHAGRLIPF